MATIKYKINNVGTNIIDLVGPVGCIAPTDLSGYCGGRGEPRFRPWLKGTATGDGTGFAYGNIDYTPIYVRQNNKNIYSGTITKGGSNGSNYFSLSTQTENNANNHNGYTEKQTSMLLSTYYVVRLTNTGTVYLAVSYNGSVYAPSAASVGASTGGTGTGLNCGGTTVILTKSTKTLVSPVIKTNQNALTVAMANYSNVFMAPLAYAEHGEKTSLNA